MPSPHRDWLARHPDFRAENPDVSAEPETPKQDDITAKLRKGLSRRQAMDPQAMKAAALRRR